MIGWSRVTKLRDVIKRVKMRFNPLTIYEIRSSLSTDFATAESWSDKFFVVSKWSEQYLLPCCKVWSCLLRWMILEWDWGANLVTRAFQTCVDTMSPYTVERTFSSKVAFNHAKINWSFFYQTRYVGLTSKVVLPVESTRNWEGYALEPSTILRRSWLFKASMNWVVQFR